VHVRIALERVGEVGPERRIGGLVGEEVVLVRERQGGKLVEIGQPRDAKALALN
jgi:hypothetical protein